MTDFRKQINDIFDQIGPGVIQHIVFDVQWLTPSTKPDSLMCPNWHGERIVETTDEGSYDAGLELANELTFHFMQKIKEYNDAAD